MNKDTAKDYLPLVQALADGKVIQVMIEPGRWHDLLYVDFSASAAEYRIKPEPREIWFNEYRDATNGGPYNSEEDARFGAGSGAKQVCYREVLE